MLVFFLILLTLFFTAGLGLPVEDAALLLLQTVDLAQRFEQRLELIQVLVLRVLHRPSE